MGGDQQEELLKTIIDKYSLLIAVVVILIFISLMMILFGVIKTIIDASRRKQLKLTSPQIEVSSNIGTQNPSEEAHKDAPNKPIKKVKQQIDKVEDDNHG